MEYVFTSMFLPFFVRNVGPCALPATHVSPFNHTQQLVALQLVSVKEPHLLLSSAGFDEYTEHMLSPVIAKSSFVEKFSILDHNRRKTAK